MIGDIFKIVFGLLFAAIGIFTFPFLGPMCGFFLILSAICFRGVK